MKKNVVLLGCNGQLGKEFKRYVHEKESAFNWVFIDKINLNLNSLTSESFSDFINTYKPLLIINCAAYTNVDKAEKEKDLAFRINGESVGIMIDILAKKSIPFIHFSTDYVFGDSSGKLLKITDKKNPLSVYGKSKLMGEENIIKKIDESYKKFFILRVSWLFSSFGKNFVKTILKCSEKQNEINIVEDQFGGPTSASSIAKLIIKLLPYMVSNKSPNNSLENSFPWGIYHFQSLPNVNWSEFAERINELAFEKKIIKKKIIINKISTSQYNSAAKRQLNSRLDCSLTESIFNIKMPNWEDDLNRVLNEIYSSNINC